MKYDVGRRATRDGCHYSEYYVHERSARAEWFSNYQQSNANTLNEWPCFRRVRIGPAYYLSRLPTTDPHALPRKHRHKMIGEQNYSRHQHPMGIRRHCPWRAEDSQEDSQNKNHAVVIECDEMSSVSPWTPRRSRIVLVHLGNTHWFGL